MPITSVLKTSTSQDSPLDASGGTDAKSPVSDFLTIQSLANFAAMTGAITAAWHALQTLDPQRFSGLWVPYAFSGVFGLVSIAISLDGLKKANSSTIDFATLLGAFFVALINALVLASAVVGTGVATSSAR